MAYPDKVSIILPTHNGARYIRTSIDSCLDQTHSNIELIVVDDGSKDETAEIVAGLKDSRLRYIRHTKNLGLPGALNTGFAQATGQFLTWTSDDNFYELHAIEVLLGFLKKNPEIGFVYSDYWEIDDNGKVLCEMKVGTPAELKRRNCIGACFLYRYQVYQAIGNYNQKARLAEDFEYWARISRQFSIAPYHQPLYHYRRHPLSLTATGYTRFQADRISVKIRRQILKLDWRNYARQMSHSYVEEGFVRYYRKDRTGALTSMARGIFYNPAWVTNRGVLSIMYHSFRNAKNNT